MGEVARKCRDLRTRFKFYQVTSLSANTSIARSHAGSLLSCTGTHTHSLPSLVAGEAGKSFYFFNSGTGLTTISGTINGDANGYQLTNQYQYVEITWDGANWIVTENN